MKKVNVGDLPLGTLFSFSGKGVERWSLLDRAGFKIEYACLGTLSTGHVRIGEITLDEVYVEDKDC